MNGLFECHGHALMDGMDYRAARARHTAAPDEEAVRAALDALREHGVTYFRDGGDALGVSLLARSLAPEYGIEYRSPAFAVCRRGHYGTIVGRAYETREEYLALLRAAEADGADFIKLIVSGLLTFRRCGELSEAGLPPEEIRYMVREAHAAGFAVMVHVNGDETVRAVLEAGADSIEHGYFTSAETRRVIAEADCFWVPTLAAIAGFRGRQGFDERIVDEILQKQYESLGEAAALGAHIAPGSDSGAVGVPHGEGAETEYRMLRECGLSEESFTENAAALAGRFRRK